MHAGIVQRIFNDHFADFRSQKILSPHQAGAAWSIMTCRTEAQGYHIHACPNGDYQVVVLNSCKHRACPQCGATGNQLWLERHNAQALDCPYQFGEGTLFSNCFYHQPGSSCPLAVQSQAIYQFNDAGGLA